MYDSLEPDQSTAASPIYAAGSSKINGASLIARSTNGRPHFLWMSQKNTTWYWLLFLITETSFQRVSISHCYIQRILMVVAGELLSNLDSLGRGRLFVSTTFSSLWKVWCFTCFEFVLLCKSGQDIENTTLLLCAAPPGTTPQVPKHF